MGMTLDNFMTFVTELAFEGVDLSFHRVLVATLAFLVVVGIHLFAMSFLVSVGVSLARKIGIVKAIAAVSGRRMSCVADIAENALGRAGTIEVDQIGGRDFAVNLHHGQPVR